MSYITQISLRWRLATLAGMLLVIAGGLWTMTRLQVEMFPDVDFPLIVLSTVYPEADAETVLQDVTIPMENAASGIDGVETVQSISSPGLALVITEFEFGTDMDAAAEIVAQNLLEASFPQGVQLPRVARVNLDEFPVLQFSVSHTGELSELLPLVMSEVIPVIEGVDGVFTVEVPSSAAAGTSITRTNGKPSLGISIIKEPDANTVKVVNEILDKLEETQAALPSNVDIDIIVNQAEDIEESISGLQREATLGALFAVVVIFIFLFSVRPTLVIGVSIPVSILGGLIMMGWWGMSLNILTLGGLAIAVGRVVDDSIVVMENIFRHIQMGEDRVRAALAATREVAGAITTSTLTTVAVFAPLGFISGIIGAFFRPFALTVTFALLASLLVSLTIVPVLGSIFIRPKDVTGEGGETRLQRLYTPILRWSLAHKLYTLLAALAIFIGSLALWPLIPKTFLPSGDEGYLSAQMTLPRSTTMEAMLASDGPVEQVEEFLEGLRNDGTVDTYQVSVGSGDMLFGPGGGFGAGANTASILVQLTNEANPQETVELLRQEWSAVDRRVVVNTVQSGGPNSDALELVFSGDEYAEVVATADHIVEALRQIDGLVDVGSDAVVAGPGLPGPGTVTRISRVNGRQAVTISGTITEANTQAMNQKVSQLVDEVGLPPGVELQTGGVFADTQEAFAQMGIAILTGIILVYLVMVVTMRSLLSPFVIILSLPLASIGALAALYITQRTLGLPALIGILMLIGLVVTNAIVLIVYVEQLRARGMTIYEALMEGGRTRLRPIMMTAFTTSFALLPLAVLVSGGVIVGAELATVVIGGLMASTFLTLLVIPVLYRLLRRERREVQAAAGSE